MLPDVLAPKGRLRHGGAAPNTPATPRRGVCPVPRGIRSAVLERTGSVGNYATTRIDLLRHAPTGRHPWQGVPRPVRPLGLRPAPRLLRDPEPRLARS